MAGTGERGEGTKGEERVNDTKSNHTLETFQFLSVGCIFFFFNAKQSFRGSCKSNIWALDWNAAQSHSTYSDH